MSVLIIKKLKYYTSKNILWRFGWHKSIPWMKIRILIAVPEHAPRTEGACRFKCLYSLEEVRSMWSPHPWVVSTVSSPLGHSETAQCSIEPVTLSSSTAQIQVKLSVQLLQYHGLTASLWTVQQCTLYWVCRIQFTCRWRII